MTNSVDPDQTLRSAASDLILYCLLKAICPTAEGKGTYVRCPMWVYAVCSGLSLRILGMNTVHIQTFSHAANCSFVFARC